MSNLIIEIVNNNSVINDSAVLTNDADCVTSIVDPAVSELLSSQL